MSPARDHPNVDRRFPDHFSAVAQDYAAHRPGYPAGLFAWLAELAPERRHVWDCGTGNGQAAMSLAQHFEQVTASDASAEQIAAASPHPRIEYQVAPAEASGLADATVDLVTVAQALHWFDLEAFYAEVRRVLIPRGVLAVWTYTRIETADPELQEPIHHFYRDTIGRYWPPQRRHVEFGYRDLAFPFEPIDAPSLSIELDWPLDHFLGYLRSWSATRRFVAERGFDPVDAIGCELARRWGDVQRLRWPLILRAGRVV